MAKKPKPKVKAKRNGNRKTLLQELDHEQPQTDGAFFGCGHEVDTRAGIKIVTIRTRTLRTVPDMCKEAKIDLKEWEVERSTVGKWDQVAKTSVRVVGDTTSPTGWDRTLAATELWTVKVWLKKKTDDKQAFESLLDEMKRHSVRVPKFKHKKPKGKQRRALEISIMDPHIGLQAFRPGSDLAWDLDIVDDMFMWSVGDLMEKAKAYGPFDEILWVFGNDFMHADCINNETTGGTIQPESYPWHTVYERAKKIAMAAGDFLKKHAPLRIVQISGNHDRMATFTLGHCLECYYWHDKNVTVEVNPAPYKFWRYGVNLVGLDHGHCRKLERLAGVMAQETRLHGWQDARYCEWHLGDQHRKGSGRLVAMAEVGVGVEFLPGLVPANEWHKIKTFNWQPRAGTAYVWGYHTGPEVRLNCHIDSYTGRPMGEVKHLKD